MLLSGHFMYPQGSWTQEGAATAFLLARVTKAAPPKGRAHQDVPWPSRQRCRGEGADLGQGAASLLSVARTMQQSPG